METPQGTEPTMETPQIIQSPIPNAPKTKKVRMPDGTIKVKVLQSDGSWKWARPESNKKTVSPTVPPVAQSSDTPVAIKPAAVEPAASTLASAQSKAPIATEQVSPLLAKPSAKTPRNFSRFFKSAQVLDAVLPEHLKVGADLADEVGMGNSDNDNSDNDNVHGPSSADSKQLAELVASGIKVKVKKAKKSVYRPGEVGSSDEEEYYDEKMHASSADDISTMKERAFTSDTKGGKDDIQVTEKEFKPRPLKKRHSKGRRLQRRTSRLAQGVAWSIAFLFPLLFMLLACLNASMDKKIVESSPHYNFGVRLMEANKICISIWPILFGAIVAQSFRMYAAWKVERGIKLVQLEQFIGSHSLATAIKQPFFLQTVNWTAIGMICLWALSPIAGQSFGRMLDTTTINNSTIISVNFSDYTINQVLSDDVRGAADTSSVAVVNLLFATALYTDNANPLLDIWGHPLIPYNDTETTRTHLNALHQQYSSFVGMPLLPFGHGDYSPDENYPNTTAAIPYASWVLQCSDYVNTTIDAINSATTYPHDGYISGPYSTYKLWPDSGKTTWMAAMPPASYLAQPYNLTNGTTVYPPYSDYMADRSQPGTIYIAINHTDSNGDFLNGTYFTDEVAFWNCTYYTQRNDVTFFCPGNADCLAIGTERKANGSNTYISNRLVMALLDSLGTQVSLSNKGYYSLFAQYLMNPFLMLGQVAPDDVSDSETAVQAHGSMAAMLGKLLNTYYEVATIFPLLDHRAIGTGGVGGSYSIYYGPPNMNTTNGTLDVGITIYRMHWQWFGVLIFSCILLLVFGIAGIILDSKTLGPDILGFASSLTRDNRYIKVEDDVELGKEGASSKNAFETMRDLKDHKVVLQDVKGHEEVGKIALASVGYPTGKPLNKERLYR